MSQRIIGSNTLVQGALPTILSNTPKSFFDDTINVIQNNAKLAFTKLRGIPGLMPVMPQGAMYMMVRIDRSRFPGFKSDLQFVERWSARGRRAKSSGFQLVSSQQHFALVPVLRANQQEKHFRTHDLEFVLFDSLCVCNFCFQGHCLKQLCTFQCAQAEPRKQIFTLEKCDLETFDHYYEKTSPGQQFDKFNVFDNFNTSLLHCQVLTN